MRSFEVYKRFLAESAAGSPSADVLWSPAMDMQMKLVNDGHAQAYRSPEAAGLPKWAVWRNEAFGTTFEPVVFVYNKRLLAPGDVTHTRAAFLQLLREQPKRFKGKVTTYDIEKVGIGFLLATQDSMTSPAFWDLANAMFDAGAFLHPTTGVMLERIASGESLIGYNLLGSYVIVRAKTDPSIGYVLPSDYTLVVSRIALIAKRAQHPNAAKLWIDFILSRDGQRIIANEAQLFSLRDDVEGTATAAGIAQALGGSIKPIVVGPGLLTYQDQAKRLEFIRKWRKAVAREPSAK
jgi:iron(III) transport system substrate-binding protein